MKHLTQYVTSQTGAQAADFTEHLGLRRPEVTESIDRDAFQILHGFDFFFGTVAGNAFDVVGQHRVRLGIFIRCSEHDDLAARLAVRETFPTVGVAGRILSSNDLPVVTLCLVIGNSIADSAALADKDRVTAGDAITLHHNSFATLMAELRDILRCEVGILVPVAALAEVNSHTGVIAGCIGKVELAVLSLVDVEAVLVLDVGSLSLFKGIEDDCFVRLVGSAVLAFRLRVTAASSPSVFVSPQRVQV